MADQANEEDEASPRAVTPSSDGMAAQQSEEEAALEDWIAFQEQQEPQEPQDDNDDPNIVFLREDGDDEDAIPNPNMDNPAAVALRNRLEENRQRAADAQQRHASKSFLLRLASGVSYGTISFTAALLLVLHTLRTRQQFYLTVMYLQSSKLSYVVMGNAVVAMGVSTFGMVTKLFLGGLRVNERDAIGEHIRWDVTETCLALTIFRSEMDVATAVRFLGLVIVKCLHWSVELRGSHLRMTEEVFIYPQENDPPTDDGTNNQRQKLPWYKRIPHFRMSHMRFYSLLYILTIVDIVAVAHCALSVATDGPSVSILFGFESAILLVTALSGLSMYHVHVIDGIMGILHHCAEGEHHYNAVGAMAEPTRDENETDQVDRENQGAAGDAPVTENTSTAALVNDNARQKSLAKTLVERVANPWKSRRATLSFAIELQAQAAKFLFYVVFFAIVFTYYGMPINIFREVYVAFQQLRRRLIAFNNYRRLTHNMEKRFESIEDEEELNRLGHTCIICRDQMDLSGGCKKLPICGHAFHTHCLREWLVQQQSCPTCRADIAANEARRKRQLEREAAEATTTEAAETAEGSDAAVVVAESVTDPTSDNRESEGLNQEEGNSSLLAQQKSEPKSTSQAGPNIDLKQSTSNPVEQEALIPGWVQEWDPVSNRTYYWNKDTNETSWSRPVMQTDVLSQFNAYLQQHNANRHEQLLQHNAMQRRQNDVAASIVSHTLNKPCLYRIKNPLGALVYKRHAASTRVVPRGKIIVCITVEYWPELGASMFSMPDGYVNSIDVERFLTLDMPSAENKKDPCVQEEQRGNLCT